jgi:ATP-dependent DNA helicase DinG
MPAASTPGSGPDLAEYNEQIDRIFGRTGALEKAIGGFNPRTSQAAMAKAVAAAIVDYKTVVAEAGTGTGKTFAYLVPALLWGGKVIISTGSKTLQDQLYLRDIPTVRRAVGLPLTTSLLKGRSNYVCLHHLEHSLADGRFHSREEVHDLREIARFAKSTTSGDRTELKSIPETATAWARATSTRETCRGSECGHYGACFVMKARKEAQAADIVVVNHHLFFADVALKDTGISELLPSANTVVFDEAHQLPDTATLFFGETISTSKMVDLCQEIRAEGLAHARDGADWMRLTESVLQEVQQLRLAVPQDTIRMAVHQLPSRDAFVRALTDLIEGFAPLLSALTSQAERAESIGQCKAAAHDLNERLLKWSSTLTNRQSDDAEKADSILWVEGFTSSLHLHRTPLSIAPIFSKQREDSSRSWIFTSATLSVGGDFSHYALQMGLQGAECFSWPSPFDYGRQGLLYVPQGLPEPSAPHYTNAAADVALPVIEAARGRTFFLCTTLRAVDRVAQRLRSAFAERNISYPILVQGEMSRGALIDRFRTDGNAVLVASQSFWEGIDVKGDLLSVVIIDKLPFSPPDDPVLAARLRALEKEGLNPFMHYQLPETIISLKQGAGRLIRDEADRGILMLCDPRLITKAYGRRIWQSLPAFKRTRNIEDVQAFFAHEEGRKSL